MSRLAASLLCCQAHVSARGIPSSLARNSRQSDANRVNPHRVSFMGTHYYLKTAIAPNARNRLDVSFSARNKISTSYSEVPMNAHDELFLWHALHRLEVTYWYDVDFNDGRGAHELFIPDGVKTVGHNRFEGREEIREFYKWRARKGVRYLGISGTKAVRHLISNLYVASSGEGCATVLGIVSFYGGVSYPSKRQSSPPMLVADLINECVLSKDNAWLYKSHTLRPVFLSNETTPPSMMVDLQFLNEER
jgi:hypothetical protein